MRSRLFYLLFLFTLFTTTLLRANDFSTPQLRLKERFQKAQPGDYVVLKQSRNLTLIHIFDKKNDLLTLEEITLPEEQLIHLQQERSNPFSWKGWVKACAPHNTCHVIYEISLKSGKIQEYYSLSQKRWLNLAQVENILPTLLNLNFSLIPEWQRRKVGAPPLAGQIDTRTLWQPRMIMESKVIPGTKFDLWRADWPKDQSELSGKTLELYLPKEAPGVLSYFPYWLQIETGLNTTKIRVVDSGLGMHSSVNELPRRSPEFVKPPHFEGKNLKATLITPLYFYKLQFFAIDSDDPSRALIPLAFKIIPAANDLFTLEVTEENLSPVLHSGHSYFFMITPEENPKFCSMTNRPILYKRL